MTSPEHLAMAVAFLAASQLVVGLIVAGYARRMTREAARFAGCTPTVLIPSATCTLRLSDLFKTGHLSRTSFEAMERSFVTRRGLLAWMGAVGIAAFIPRTGDAMKDSAKLKVLFIAGFGPIVRDTGESRTLYRDALGIPFKEEPDGYLHTEAVPGAKSFALWPLSQVAQSCFGKDSWPKEIPAPQAWLEFDVESVEKATEILKSRGYRMLVKNKKEPWGQIVSRFISPEGVLVGITFTPLLREQK